MSPPVQGGIVLVVTEAEEFLRKEPSGRAAFSEVAANVQRELSEPIASGEWWDRPAVPFHVVLVCRTGQDSAGWSSPRIG